MPVPVPFKVKLSEVVKPSNSKVPPLLTVVAPAEVPKAALFPIFKIPALIVVVPV